MLTQCKNSAILDILSSLILGKKLRYGHICVAHMENPICLLNHKMRENDTKIKNLFKQRKR